MLGFDKGYWWEGILDIVSGIVEHRKLVQGLLLLVSFGSLERCYKVSPHKLHCMEGIQYYT